QRRGWHVVFGSIDRTEYAPYAQALRECGADLIAGFGPASLDELAREGIAVDAAWLCRPDPAARLIDSLSAHGAKLVFDTVDLHYVRLEREENVTGTRTGWQTERSRELELAKRATVTVTTTTTDRNALQDAGIANVAVVPVIEAIPPRSTIGFEQRSGVVFL